MGCCCASTILTVGSRRGKTQRAHALTAELILLGGRGLFLPLTVSLAVISFAQLGSQPPRGVHSSTGDEKSSNIPLLPLSCAGLVLRASPFPGMVPRLGAGL